MKEATLQVDARCIELAASAPSVRITAGVGSAGQKTWNVRRPVTLIGSRRPAQIILHHQDISKAHCVIINTGREVLLKDLHTSGGTFCKGERIDLVTLNDGDVVTLGHTNIQIAIRAGEDVSDDSTCGVNFVEPTKLRTPAKLSLANTERSWLMEDSVILIGRHPEATVHLDHADISRRNTVLFRFGDGLGVYDLGSQAGTVLNGEPRGLAQIGDGDCIGVGPFDIHLTCEYSVQPPQSQPASTGTGNNGVVAEQRDSSNSNASAVAKPSVSAELSDALSLDAGTLESGSSTDPTPSLSQIETGLHKLQDDLGASWERVNQWHAQLQEDASALDSQKADVAAREVQLEAKDAALRGQLHDLTRYQEQLAERERELAAQLRRIQQEEEELTANQLTLSTRAAEVDRHDEELRRREHVLAQRWARLQSSKCPHCHKPIRA